MVDIIKSTPLIFPLSLVQCSMFNVEIPRLHFVLLGTTRIYVISMSHRQVVKRNLNRYLARDLFSYNIRLVKIKRMLYILLV